MVRSSSKATAAFAVVAGIVAAVLVVTSRGAGRVSLMDADAPTSSEVAYAKKTLSALPVRHAAGKAKGRLQQAFQIPHAKIQAQNNKLQKQVVGLEHEVRELSADLTRKGHGHAVKRAQRQIHASVQPPATGQKLRMQWGQQAIDHPKAALQGLRGRPQAHLTKLVPETESGSAYYHVANLGDNAEALTTQAGDSNPIAALQPGDYWKDPQERPFLHAPNPHDPASTLAHTVTGDYASPATWGEIYEDKETIDWCSEQYDWFSDRIKCIEKLHAQGPLLG